MSETQNKPSLLQTCMEILNQPSRLPREITPEKLTNKAETGLISLFHRMTRIDEETSAFALVERHPPDGYVVRQHIYKDPPPNRLATLESKETILETLDPNQAVRAYNQLVQEHESSAKNANDPQTGLTGGR